ncbi:hypothetical protein D3C74_309270 [compost metagenome]
MFSSSRHHNFSNLNASGEKDKVERGMNQRGCDLLPSLHDPDVLGIKIFTEHLGKDPGDVRRILRRLNNRGVSRRDRPD